MARAPLEAELTRLKWAQPAQKLPRVFTRTCFVRFFEALKRSESEKSRKILLCSIVYKISSSFRTASADSGPKRIGLAKT
jgi:hypothetical protein